MTGRKIMIVDDDEDIHTLYGLYLQGEGFQMIPAFDGKQALELLEKEKPDLIVLDMIMPVMGGEEFFIKLRTGKQICDVPVIIASVNENVPQKLLDLGNIQAILKKPFAIEALIEKVREALSESPK